MDELDEVLKLRNLYKAARKCSAGSMWKSGTALYRWDALENSVKLQNAFRDGTYKLQRYQRFDITRPKPRQITATRIRDRHIQRSACDNVLYARLTRSFIHNNGACQVGKGVDFELNRVKCGLQHMLMMKPAPEVIKNEKRRLRRMVRKVAEGKATVDSVRVHYQGWRAHMEHGDTGRQLENMDKYLDGLLAAIEKGGHENEHQHDQRTAPRARGSAGQTPDQHHGQRPGHV